MLYSENMPTVPVVHRRFSLPAGMTGRAVLENVQVEESTDQLDLKRVEEPLVWPQGFKFNFAPVKAGRMFPGKFVESHDMGGVILGQHFSCSV